MAFTRALVHALPLRVPCPNHWNFCLRACFPLLGGPQRRKFPRFGAFDRGEFFRHWRPLFLLLEKRWARRALRSGCLFGRLSPLRGPLALCLLHDFSRRSHHFYACAQPEALRKNRTGKAKRCFGVTETGVVAPS